MTEESKGEELAYIEPISNHRVNAVIQVIDSANPALVGCIMQITDIRESGVLAAMRIPHKGGTAYFRLKYGEFAYIGEAVMIPDHTNVSSPQKAT